jgi:hypothetical protein
VSAAQPPLRSRSRSSSSTNNNNQHQHQHYHVLRPTPHLAGTGKRHCPTTCTALVGRLSIPPARTPSIPCVSPRFVRRTVSANRATFWIWPSVAIYCHDKGPQPLHARRRASAASYHPYWARVYWQCTHKPVAKSARSMWFSRPSRRPFCPSRIPRALAATQATTCYCYSRRPGPLHATVVPQCIRVFGSLD